MSEENAYLNELGEPISIPPSTVDDPVSPVRLCEYDESAQGGCRRTQTILALEAEYDTFAHPEMEWGNADQYCRHEGFMYYNKARMQWLFDDDVEVRAADAESGLYSDPAWLAASNAANDYAGYQLIDREPQTWNNTFTVKPAGFPTVILETPQFYQCEDVASGELITTDNITREKLDIIESSFTGDWHPYTNDLTGALYIKDGKAYCTDATVFENHPTIKLGVILSDSDSNLLFYAFTTLTQEEINFVNGITWCDSNKTIEVIYL
jgi:hypothetical protein